MARTIFTAEARLFQPKEWKRVEYTARKAAAFCELVRVLEMVDDNLQASALAYADWCVDASNDPDQTNDPAAVRYVDNPRAGPKAYAGRWRLVSNRAGSVRLKTKPTDIFGIIQTLRLGLAESLYWDEALIEQEYLSKDLKLTFLNLNPDKLNAIAGAVASSYTTLTIRGESYGGPWYNHGVVTDIDKEDGSGVMVVYLSQDTESITIPRENTAGESTQETITHVGTRAGANSELASEIGTLLEGQFKSGQIGKDEHGVWQSIMTQATGNALTTGWIEITNAYGGIDRVIAASNINAAALSAIVGAIRTAVVVGSYYYMVHERAQITKSQRYAGLYDVMIHEHGSELHPVGVADPWINSVYTCDQTQEQYRQTDGKKRTRTIHRGVKYTGSISAAYAYIADGLYPESHVQSIGKQLEKNIAIKITAGDWEAWS